MLPGRSVSVRLVELRLVIELGEDVSNDALMTAAAATLPGTVLDAYVQPRDRNVFLAREAFRKRPTVRIR